MNSAQIIKLIKQQANQITSQIIKDLIKDHSPTKKKTEKLYNEYLADVEIKKRSFVDTNKVNNKLPNDYRGDIIDGIVGYMFGEPITYEIDKKKYKEGEYNTFVSSLDEFKSRNSIEDLDSSTGEMMSICGYAARLLYIDREGKERIMNINPWEVIFVMDPTIDEVQFAMIYYDIEVVVGTERKKRTKVEWYDNKNVYYYISTDNDEFILDVNQPQQQHMFNFVPVIKFVNNNAEKGDFEKVDELIDAYDKTLSDIQNEIEEFRIAYLALFGVEPTPEAIETAKRTGVLGFPEGSNGEFLIKDLSTAVEFMKDHKKTLNDNIYKFAKAVDMRDENFSGSAMSGESRKWKLVGLENRAKTKERKFIKALKYQFKVLCSAWSVKEIKLNYMDIDYQFKRNLPIDLKYHAESTQAFKGQISEKTRLGLLPFIADPEEELQQMKDEMGDIIDFNTPPANPLNNPN